MDMMQCMQILDAWAVRWSVYEHGDASYVCVVTHPPAYVCVAS